MATFARENAKVQEVYYLRRVGPDVIKYERQPFNLITFDDRSGQYIEPAPLLDQGHVALELVARSGVGEIDDRAALRRQVRGHHQPHDLDAVLEVEKSASPGREAADRVGVLVGVAVQVGLVRLHREQAAGGVRLLERELGVPGLGLHR